MRPIYIRVDAGGIYGMGHLQRCRAIATALWARGAHAITCCTWTPSVIAPHLPAGIALAAPDFTREGVWIFDCPDVPEAECVTLLRHDARIVLIDMPAARRVDADLVVLPGLHHPPHRVDPLLARYGERLFFGAEAVIIPEAMRLDTPAPYSQRFPWIVVLTGASDPHHHRVVLEQLLRPYTRRFRPYRLLVCIGSENRWHWWFGLSRWHSLRRVHWDRAYLRQATMAISLFGQSIYDLLWYRTPTLIVSDDDVDREGAAYLAQTCGCRLKDGGSIYALRGEAFAGVVASLIEDPEQSRVRIDNTPALFDGLGAERIADRILAWEA